MLLKQTQSFLQKLNDEQLLAYIREGVASYEPDAVAFAEAEFRRRDLTPARIEDVVANVGIKEAADAAKAGLVANLPLGAAGRLLAFFSGCCFSLFAVIFFMMASTRLKDRGELRKSRQLWTWFGIGVAFLFLTALVITIIQDSGSRHP